MWKEYLEILSCCNSICVFGSLFLSNISVMRFWIFISDSSYLGDYASRSQECVEKPFPHQLRDCGCAGFSSSNNLLTVQAGVWTALVFSASWTQKWDRCCMRPACPQRPPCFRLCSPICADSSPASGAVQNSAFFIWLTVFLGSITTVANYSYFSISLTLLCIFRHIPSMYFFTVFTGT